MRLLVKIGGSLLDSPEARTALAGGVAAIRKGGAELVLVHGGGKQMTRFLAGRGIESRFVRGLRVTTPEIADAVLKVFTGTVNPQLVSALVAAGLDAVGLSGIDAALVEAEQLDPELGAVGRPVRVNARLLEVLAQSGYLPVVACVAGDRAGRVYNVNADQMASACAAAFRAARLIFLTDVDGVRGGDGAVIPRLTAAAAEQLIATGVASGGMEAKLRAALAALDGGGEVSIAPGAAPDVLKRLLDGEPLGTRLVQ